MEWWEFSDFRERGVPFAIDVNGRWRDVDSVPRGKACGCFCPDCKGPLIARQGDVLVHHFAHDARQECRHALEASLYGMAVSILSEPGALLLLPSADPGIELAESRGATDEELQTLGVAPVEPAGLLRIESAHARTTDLQSSDPMLPDLVFPGPKITLHLLSHRKNREQAGAAPHDPDACSVGLNLRTYVNLWWEVCATDQATKLRAVGQAQDLMRGWLAGQLSGRGWLHHPILERTVESLRARLDALRAERIAAAQRAAAEQQQAAQRAREEAETRQREADRVWRIPPLAPAVPGPSVMKPATPEAHTWLTPSLAINYDLEWHRDRRLYFFVGDAGAVVPEAAREVLDPGSAWEPVRPADEAAFASLVAPELAIPRPYAPPLSPRPEMPPPPVVKRLDEVLGPSEKKCWCGAFQQEIRVGSGYYANRRILRCSANPKHPFSLID